MNKRLVLHLKLVAPRLLLLLLLVAWGSLLALVPWEWAALLVMGSIVLIGLLIRPQCALCLLAFAVPFGSIKEWPFGPLNIRSTELLILFLLAFWLARMAAARRIIIPHAPLLVPLLLFLVALFFSTLATSSLILSAKEIVKWLEVIIIYLFMADAVDVYWGRWIIWALLSAGCAEALVGIYQFLFRVGPEWFFLFGRFMRAYGHFAQPNPFAGYLGLTLPLAYALTLEAFEAWQKQVRRPWANIRLAIACILPRIAPAVSCAVMLVAIVMSWSRGGWVGLAVAILVTTVTYKRTALIAVTIIGVLMVYLFLLVGVKHLPPELMQRISDFMPYLGGIDLYTVEVTEANWAVAERMAHWLAAVGMFTDHPWLGVGIGNYPVAYPQYAIGRWRDPLGHAHNYYLNIAAETGVIGLSAYLFLLVACFIQTRHVIRHTQGYWRAVALGALGMLVHLSVHNLFDNLFVHNMNVQLALLLGLLLVAEKSAGVGSAHWH